MPFCCYGIDRRLELGCGKVAMVTSLLSTALPFFFHHYGFHAPISLNVLFDLFQVDDAQEMINSAANQVMTEPVYLYRACPSFALITHPSHNLVLRKPLVNTISLIYFGLR